MRVAVLDDYHDVFASDLAVARLRGRVPVDIFTEKLSAADRLERLRGYPILIANRERTRFDRALLSALPELRLIAQTGNHAYHIDLEAARELGVTVRMGSSDRRDMTRMAASTVELTFGLMLAALRKIPQTDRALRAGAWPNPLGHTLDGKTLGILGLGRIGREVARLARAFGMQVIAWGPTLDEARAHEAGATFVDLDALLERSDVVSVHLKLSDQSRGLLNEARLRRMRPGAYLVNTARGAIIDEAALARVLSEGAIAGAALDVFVEEPLPESPLRGLDNVVLTPHLGWIADQTYRFMAEAVVRIVEEYLDASDSPTTAGPS